MTNENVLTDEEILKTASTPGPRSPWAVWAPSVLGATIMHLMAERDEARGIRREDERVERTVEGIDVLTFDDETVFTWSGVVTRCWKCGDEVELITEELVDGKAPDKYLCAECDG